MKKLSPFRQRFIEEYLVDLNGTAAYKRAGGAEKGATAAASRMLTVVNVQQAIAEAKAKRSEKLEITADMWLRELWIIGHSNIENYMKIDEGGLIIAKTFEEMPENASRALEAIEENRTIKESADGKDSNIINAKVKFKVHSKIEALKLIGQHLGFLQDHLRLSGKLDLNAKLSISDMKKSMKGLSDAS
jgi:phage terminase small subunit